MKFSKGTVKNINKKLVSGLLVLTLTTTGLAGCVQYNNFDYSVTEQGEYQVSGVIDYELFKNYRFIVIENKENNTNEFYICKAKHIIPTYTRHYYVYFNVFNNEKVFDENKADGTRNLICFATLENYLYATNNIKKYYTIDDIEQIFNEMKENYLNENNKQLVKEK